MATDRRRTPSALPLLHYIDETPPASPPRSTYHLAPHRVPTSRRIRRLVTCLCACLLLAVLLTTWSIQNGSLDTARVPVLQWHRHGSDQEEVPNQYPSDITQNYTHDAQTAVHFEDPQYSPWVLGAPTQQFRDNLKPDLKYITSWLDAGWNNDVMTYMNLIYLGYITDRIPILADFTPNGHIGTDSPSMPFSEVFDIPRFISTSGIPILEWAEVKERESEVVDDVGCWNVWESVQYDERGPRNSDGPRQVGLDISYTRTPEWIKMIPGYEHDKGASFWALARLAYPHDRTAHLRNDVRPSALHGHRRNPDEWMLCFDYLYYVGGHQSMEWDYAYAPAWRYVGRYLHWTERIEIIADSYLRDVLELSNDEEIPPYITIHVRHGDFKDWCWDAEQPEDCFAPLSVISRRVKEVQAELLRTKHIHIPAQHVIMTSDEDDEGWWEEVGMIGWRRVDHARMRTEERFGRWYPLVLDSVIQSNSIGFIGTDRSTFSILSMRRVVDWNEGVVRMVRWGRRGADDH